MKNLILLVGLFVAMYFFGANLTDTAATYILVAGIVIVFGLIVLMLIWLVAASYRARRMEFMLRESAKPMSAEDEVSLARELEKAKGMFRGNGK